MPASSPDGPAGAETGAPRRATTWVFAAMTAVLVLTAVAYVAWASNRDQATSEGGGDKLTPGASGLLFHNLAPTGFGRVAVASISDPDSTRRLADLSCERVHYADGRGICLTYDSGFGARPQIKIFNAGFRVTKTLPLDGLPSRARVSADGRYGAATTFVTGHSYSESTFSTNTVLVDMRRGAKVANLEQFTVMRDGRRYTARDVNFWGVTFAEDSNRFFATLSTRGKTYLVEGDVAARRVVVGRENVECPSLSPDGTRIGYKKRVDDGGGTPRWRFHVLDLASGEDTPLAETRSIDDQLEWLDDDTVLYGDPESSHAVMAVPADGTGEPRRLISQAESPTVLRPSQSEPDTSGLDRGTEMAQADLEVTVDAPTTATGETVVHTITVTNKGPGTATQIFIDDKLSGPARVVSAEGHPAAGVSSYGCSLVPDEARARCDLSELPAGSSWSASVEVGFTGSGPVDGEIRVTAAEPDPVADNDIETVSTASP